MVWCVGNNNFCVLGITKKSPFPKLWNANGMLILLHLKSTVDSGIVDMKNGNVVRRVTLLDQTINKSSFMHAFWGPFWKDWSVNHSLGASYFLNCLILREFLCTQHLKVSRCLSVILNVGSKSIGRDCLVLNAEGALLTGILQMLSFISSALLCFKCTRQSLWKGKNEHPSNIWNCSILKTCSEKPLPSVTNMKVKWCNETSART